MTELLTSAQMRAIEAAAIASGEVTGLELMERAGQGVVEAIFEEWPELRATSHRAVVLCGPGNNGGDGFVVARLLKEWGWEVEVFLYGDPEKMPPDARVNYERWLGMGKVKAFPVGLFLPRCDFLIDALFGTGLSRPIPSEVSYVIANQHKSKGTYKCIAVDVPSGICADSGKSLEIGGRADLTVTFHRPKQGHYLGDGAIHCGKLVVKSIGLSIPVFKSLNHLMSFINDPKRRKLTSVEIKDEVDQRESERLATVSVVSSNAVSLAKVTADRYRRGQYHKYSHGHALILSGPPGHGGAARLAARGALRIGAGVVTVGAAVDAIPEHAARLDAIMLREVGEGEALTAVLEDRRINALCLGPGLGLDARAEGLVAAALESRGEPRPTRGAGGPPTPSLPHEGGGRHPQPVVASGGTADQLAPPLPPVGRGWGWGAPGERRAVVLDADALTILSRDPDLFAALHGRCVLTPHAGEFARLFPDIAEKLAAPATKGPAYSKVDATREAAARAGCIVLYKGPDTVIADPSGRCSINSAHYDRAAPWLATAGSGDVLAGFIAGLLARGFGPMQAAETGAWLHVECARSFGPGLIAEDLPEELPKVFRALGL